MDGLRDIQADHPVIGDVRGLGSDDRRRIRHEEGAPNSAAVSKVI